MLLFSCYFIANVILSESKLWGVSAAIHVIAGNARLFTPKMYIIGIKL